MLKKAAQLWASATARTIFIELERYPWFRWR
jgi:hypothetical protein